MHVIVSLVLSVFSSAERKKRLERKERKLVDKLRDIRLGVRKAKEKYREVRDAPVSQSAEEQAEADAKLVDENGYVALLERWQGIYQRKLVAVRRRLDWYDRRERRYIRST